MSRSQGWGLPPSEMSQIRLLHWIYDQCAGDFASGIPSVRGFADEEEQPRDSVEHLARALERQHLLAFGPKRVGGLGTVYITAEGRRDVEQRVQRRADAGHRRQACRDAFLAWIDAQPGSSTEMVSIDGFLRDNRSIWEGEQFTLADVDAATAYLRDQGLISGVDVEELGGPVKASITAAGLDCAEAGGSVSDYLRGGPSVGTTITTHFHGTVAGQVGIGEQVQQTQHQGIDLGTLQQLLEDVREAAQQVDPDEARYLLTYADTIQAEVTTESPNADVIRGSGDRLKQIAGKIGNAGLSASVSALVNFLFRALGG
jgi:hypothetical protein